MVVPPEIGNVESVNGPEPPAFKHPAEFIEIQVKEKDRVAEGILNGVVPHVTYMPLVETALHIKVPFQRTGTRSGRPSRRPRETHSPNMRRSNASGSCR